MPNRNQMNKCAEYEEKEEEKSQAGEQKNVMNQPSHDADRNEQLRATLTTNHESYWNLDTEALTGMKNTTNTHGPKRASKYRMPSQTYHTAAMHKVKTNE